MKFQWQVDSDCEQRARVEIRLLTLKQLGYGLGTANYKGDSNSPEDKELIEKVVTAIKAGYYHLDGAEGLIWMLPYHVTTPAHKICSLWQ